MNDEQRLTMRALGPGLVEGHQAGLPGVARKRSNDPRDRRAPFVCAGRVAEDFGSRRGSTGLPLRAGSRSRVHRSNGPTDAVALLGHLVGDGSYLTHQPLRYCTASEENSALVREAAIAMGSTVTRHAGRGAWHQLVIAGNGDRWHPAGVGAWLKSLGIFGQRSHEKRLPVEALRLARRQVALLLAHLWATDGCISLRRAGRAPRVYFSTCSLRLARDVMSLLLRLGIVARTHDDAAARGKTGLRRRCQRRGAATAFSGRSARFRTARRRRRCACASTCRASSGIPAPIRFRSEVFAEVKSAMGGKASSHRAMAAARGTSYGGTRHFRFRAEPRHDGVLFAIARTIRSLHDGRRRISAGIASSRSTPPARRRSST